jgi:hypothetical protein
MVSNKKYQVLLEKTREYFQEMMELKEKVYNLEKYTEHQAILLDKAEYERKYLMEDMDTLNTVIAYLFDFYMIDKVVVDSNMRSKFQYKYNTVNHEEIQTIYFEKANPVKKEGKKNGKRN